MLPSTGWKYSLQKKQGLKLTSSNLNCLLHIKLSVRLFLPKEKDADTEDVLLKILCD